MYWLVFLCRFPYVQYGQSDQSVHEFSELEKEMDMNA